MVPSLQGEGSAEYDQCIELFKCLFDIYFSVCHAAGVFGVSWQQRGDLSLGSVIGVDKPRGPPAWGPGSSPPWRSPARHPSLAHTQRAAPPHSQLLQRRAQHREPLTHFQGRKRAHLLPRAVPRRSGGSGLCLAATISDLDTLGVGEEEEPDECSILVSRDLQAPRPRPRRQGSIHPECVGGDKSPVVAGLFQPWEGFVELQGSGENVRGPNSEPGNNGGEGEAALQPHLEGDKSAQVAGCKGGALEPGNSCFALWLQFTDP